MTKQRAKLIQRRAMYSAKGAFLGAMVGGVVGKRAAGICGGIGGILGATIAENQLLAKVRNHSSESKEQSE